MATVQVNMHEAKTHLSRLIKELEEGDEIVIANRGTAVARLVPIVRPASRRPLGTVDAGGPITDQTLEALRALMTDDELDAIGWPH